MASSRPRAPISGAPRSRSPASASANASSPSASTQSRRRSRPARPPRAASRAPAARRRAPRRTSAACPRPAAAAPPRSGHRRRRRRAARRTPPARCARRCRAPARGSRRPAAAGPRQALPDARHHALEHEREPVAVGLVGEVGDEHARRLEASAVDRLDRGDVDDVRHVAQPGARAQLGAAARSASLTIQDSRGVARAAPARSARSRGIEPLRGRESSPRKPDSRLWAL